MKPGTINTVESWPRRPIPPINLRLYYSSLELSDTQKSANIKFEPALEPLHVSVKYWFLHHTNSFQPATGFRPGGMFMRSVQPKTNHRP